MGNTSDPVGRLKARGLSPAPFAVLGALAATAGLTVFLAWPARRSSTSTRKRQALIVRSMSSADEVSCVFDNTASGAAIENAWELRERLILNPPFG